MDPPVGFPIVPFQPTVRCIRNYCQNRFVRIATKGDMFRLSYGSEIFVYCIQVVPRNVLHEVNRPLIGRLLPLARHTNNQHFETKPKQCGTEHPVGIRATTTRFAVEPFCFHRHTAAQCSHTDCIMPRGNSVVAMHERKSNKSNCSLRGTHFKCSPSAVHTIKKKTTRKRKSKSSMVREKNDSSFARMAASSTVGLDRSTHF